MNGWWSFWLTLIGVSGFVLAGRRVWWSWYVNLACQALWLAYALVTQQYGFIVAALVYSYVFAKNAILWTKEHRNKHVHLNNITVGNADADKIYNETLKRMGRHVRSTEDS